MSIPKKIHYCWFGGNPLPTLMVKCINSWKKILPDYEIKEWNESNFDIHCCKYVENAYTEKKWAFVSDYARFYALYNEGGIYFDTDIECLTTFDDIIDCDAFFGFGRRSLTLPVFGAKKNHPLFAHIIEYYNTKSFYKEDGLLDTTTIEITAEKMLVKYYGLLMNGEYQLLPDGIRIYPKEYFSSTDWQTGIITKNPKLKVIHYADGSWISDDQKKAIAIKRKAISIFGEKLGTVVGTAVYLLEKEGIGSFFKHGHSYMLRTCTKPYMKVCRKLFAKKNRIVCENFAGKGYGDNPKYIAQELLRRNKGYDIVWLVAKKGIYDFPKGIREVKTNTFSELYALATASVWIDNNRKNLHIYKAEDQFYIQTWHGYYPLKKLEKDASGQLTPEYIEAAKHDAAITDLMSSGCKARTDVYRSAFWYKGKILECGTPRNDILFTNNKETTNRVRSNFNIPDNKRIVLYAPTFRDDHSTTAYNMDYHRLCEALHRKFGGEWICMVKLHPAISSQDGIVKYDNEVINASGYSDIQELFVVSDIVISDYSDCIFEATLAGKLVLLYASDLDEYIRTRDFYYDLRSLHYKIARSNLELEQIIKDFDVEEFEHSSKVFLDGIQSYERGCASATIVDRIEKFIDEGEKS